MHSFIVGKYSKIKHRKHLTLSKYLPLLKGLMLSKESLLVFIGIILPGLLASKREKDDINSETEENTEEQRPTYNCIIYRGREPTSMLSVIFHWRW